MGLHKGVDPWEVPEIASSEESHFGRLVFD